MLVRRHLPSAAHLDWASLWTSPLNRTGRRSAFVHPGCYMCRQFQQVVSLAGGRTRHGLTAHLPDLDPRERQAPATSFFGVMESVHWQAAGECQASQRLSIVWMRTLSSCPRVLLGPCVLRVNCCRTRASCGVRSRIQTAGSHRDTGMYGPASSHLRPHARRSTRRRCRPPP